MEGSETTDKIFWKGSNILLSLEQTWQKYWRYGKKITQEDEDESLIPGLTDEIVLEEIIRKLPWSTFHVLSSVSRGWKQAIYGHRFYGEDLFECSHRGYGRRGHGYGRRDFKAMVSKLEEEVPWRLLNRCKKIYLKVLFLYQGRRDMQDLEMSIPVAQAMSDCGYDGSQLKNCHGPSWRSGCTRLHSLLCEAIWRGKEDEFFVYAARMVNGDLFVFVSVALVEEIFIPYQKRHHVCVLRSKGFGSEREEVTWEKINPSLSMDHMFRQI